MEDIKNFRHFSILRGQQVGYAISKGAMVYSFKNDSFVNPMKDEVGLYIMSIIDHKRKFYLKDIMYHEFVSKHVPAGFRVSLIDQNPENLHVANLGLNRIAIKPPIKAAKKSQFHKPNRLRAFDREQAFDVLDEYNELRKADFSNQQAFDKLAVKYGVSIQTIYNVARGIGTYAFTKTEKRHGVSIAEAQPTSSEQQTIAEQPKNALGVDDIVLIHNPKFKTHNHMAQVVGFDDKTNLVKVRTQNSKVFRIRQERLKKCRLKAAA